MGGDEKGSNKETLSCIGVASRTFHLLLDEVVQRPPYAPRHWNGPNHGEGKYHGGGDGIEHELENAHGLERLGGVVPQVAREPDKQRGEEHEAEEEVR